MQYQDRRSISVLDGASVVSIVFDSLHILHIFFISDLLDYLLPIKNGYIIGRWNQGPWGRRHSVSINLCHPELVKLQQRCHMQNTIFDLPPNWFYSFFSGRESNMRIGRENENNNPVRKCSSIITLIFGFFMALGRHSDM